MNSTRTNTRPLHLSTGFEIVGSVLALVVGALFAAEGLLGYFYNYSIMFEGLDHILEIYGGFAVAIVAFSAAIIAYLRR
jgi:hypothetical protein